MRKRGYLSSRTTKPYKPIYDRLLRREQLVGDVFRTGPGRWNLAEWYTLEEAARLKQQHVKANEEHIERTKRGIEEAKLRGRRIGVPLIVTGEVKAQILRLLAEGKGVYQTASSLNLTPEAIYGLDQGRWHVQEVPSKGTMISCAHHRVFLTVLVLASGVSGVIAAEDPLFGRLADLTVSKGDKDAQVGTTCLALGLPVKRDGSCLVYQTLAKDESGRLHSINVLNRAGKTTRSVFLFLHDDLVGKAWLIDEAGRLQKAASGIYKNEWTWTEVPIDKGAKDRFAKEIDYWRAKEEELAHEPNRKN